MLTRLRAGALACAFSKSWSNSGIPDAARVAFLQLSRPTSPLTHFLTTVDVTSNVDFATDDPLLKRYYDEQYGAGFEFAYLIPGMTRVVQSAGRVIRSESDVGIIALLCRRFTQETYTRFFPADWYEESPRELISRKPASEIRAFFEAKATPQLRLV